MVFAISFNFAIAESEKYPIKKLNPSTAVLLFIASGEKIFIKPDEIKTIKAKATAPEIWGIKNLHNHLSAFQTNLATV